MVLTIIIHAILLYTLKQTSTLCDEVGRRIKALEKMTKGIVIALIVCNGPGHMNYYFNEYYLNGRRYTMIMRGKSDEVEADVQV